MKLSHIKANPDNPRVIKDSKFKELCENIKKYPKFLELRPIILKSKKEPYPIAGNMRLAALREIGDEDIPNNWVKYADQLTDEEVDAFTIIDNVPYGEWDWDKLANEWDQEKLEGWGLDLPKPIETKHVSFEAKKKDGWYVSIKCDDEREANKLLKEVEKMGLTAEVVNK